MWASISSMYAAAVASLHYSAVRAQFRPNPNSILSQILPAILLVGVCGMIFSLGVTFYAFAKAITLQEGEPRPTRVLLSVISFILTCSPRSAVISRFRVMMLSAKYRYS